MRTLVRVPTESPRPTSDRRARLAAIAPGVGAGLALALPAAIAGQVFGDGSGASGPGAGFIVVVYAVAAGVAGWTVGRGTSRSPMADGAVAAVVIYAVVQAIALVRLVATDGDVAWAALPFFTLLAAALGVFGATLSSGRP